MGLVNKVVPAEQLDAEVEAWCREILALSPDRDRDRQALVQRRQRKHPRHRRARLRVAGAVLRERGIEGRDAGLSRKAPPRLPRQAQALTGGPAPAAGTPPVKQPRRGQPRARRRRAASTKANVVIGTTHFVNAVIQRRGLTHVAAIRIGLPASTSLLPFCDWPIDLAEIVRARVVMLEGGHDYDGREFTPFDETGMHQAARQIREDGIELVAIAAIFSPLDPSSVGREERRGRGRVDHHLGHGDGHILDSVIALLQPRQCLGLGLLQRRNSPLDLCVTTRIEASIAGRATCLESFSRDLICHFSRAAWQRVEPEIVEGPQRFERNAGQFPGPQRGQSIDLGLLVAHAGAPLVGPLLGRQRPASGWKRNSGPTVPSAHAAASSTKEP